MWGVRIRERCGMGDPVRFPMPGDDFIPRAMGRQGRAHKTEVGMKGGTLTENASSMLLAPNPNTTKLPLLTLQGHPGLL